MTVSQFNVVDFGAVGNGTTDDSAAVQAAINAAAVLGGTVIFPVPPAAYVCRNLNLLSNVALQGLAPAVHDGGVKIQAPSGSDDIFRITEGITNFSIANLHFLTARRILWFQNGGGGNSVQGKIQWCTFYPVEAAIYIDGQMERVYITGCFFGAGNYGIYFSGTRTNGNNAILDKTRFDFCHFTGQLNNAIYVNAVDGTGGCMLRSSQLTNITQDAVYFPSTGRGDGPWTFIDVVGEGAGGYGQTYVPPTTGSITTGTTSLTVASASGLVVGRKITIQGAAGGYYDLTTEITNIAGTTVTINDPAGQTVSNVEVIQAEYSMFNFNNGVRNTYINCSNQTANPLYLLRDFSPNAMACLAGRPIYSDGGGRFFDCENGVRQPYDMYPALGPTWLLATRGSADLSMGDGSRTSIATPFGKDWWALLTDSAGTGLGSFGNFQVRRGSNNPNADVLFLVDGTSGNAGFQNAICMAMSTYGTGAAPLAIFTGTGSPNGAVSAQIGSLYLNQSGGSGTTLYVKESGAGTNTGWVGK